MSILISIIAKILQPVLILTFWFREKKLKTPMYIGVSLNPYFYYFIT